MIKKPRPTRGFYFCGLSIAAPVGSGFFSIFNGAMK
jgi:hypothetical protein